jgi:hypothetical protein
MNEILHSQDQISIAYFVKEVNDLFGKNGNILQKALFEVGIELAEIIQASLDSRNKLRRVNNESPRSTPPVAVDRDIPMISPELLGWSIAILASAWRELVFASKSEENSKYQTDPNYKNYPDRQAAIVNVKLAVPYVQCTIIDAIYNARQIGNCRKTNYEPNPEADPAYISLRKEC